MRKISILKRKRRWKKKSMSCSSWIIVFIQTYHQGLDTLTPTLTVGDRLKMVGEYEETVGTCYLFSESAEPKPPSDETTPSDVTTEKPASSSKEAPSKEVNHLASVHKILKFRPINAEAPAAQSISG
ncbi:uncharacterized protein LOC120642575 isoform X4 [Panicum virgatum]|uniref:uncharacterized protein LOC120642575 isoform X4 n=1 Tax=Panicum virgatum TaxID=38727 RepID=UPI0019D5CA77|nr:uncharacterized protein LOC120642575 isoform X4 [Panicum virgatum]